MERLEVRSRGGTLLGVLVGGTALEIKRGPRLFTVDLLSMLCGEPVVVEQVLQPENRENGQGETGPHTRPAA